MALQLNHLDLHMNNCQVHYDMLDHQNHTHKFPKHIHQYL